MARMVAIDTETSGLDPDTGADIIMICALELLDERQSGSAFQAFVKPSHPLTPAVEELTGITNEALITAPSFAEIADQFLDFIADAELVCLNAPFEAAFLNRALAGSRNPKIPHERFMDLMSKLPREFREQGIDGIYSYSAIEPNPLATASEEVSRLYWALMDY